MKWHIVFLTMISYCLSFAQGKSKDLETLDKARVQYEKGAFAEALKTYSSISKDSDYWLIAEEEKAWGFFRMDQYHKSLAEVTTLTSSALSGLVGAEPYLLKSLILLRTCDYKEVFKTLEEFKKNKKDQMLQVQDLANKGTNAHFDKAFSEWIKKPESWESAGPDVAFLPRLFHRDQKLQALVRQKNLTSAKLRFKELAEIEAKDNARIMQKLSLVEVEAIQGLHITESDGPSQGNLDKKSEYDMVFNDNGKEVWLDELDKHRAQVKRCASLKGKTML